jgi:hypothetical protein
MSDIKISNKSFSDIIGGSSNFNSIESNLGNHLVLSCNALNESDSINFVTNHNNAIQNRMSILSNGNINVKSNLNIDTNYTINNLRILEIDSRNNTSSGSVIKGQNNKSLYISIEGEDIKDSFNILYKKNNIDYNNLFCVKYNGIGINTTDPKSELDINGTLTSNKISIRDNSSSIIKFNQNNIFKVGIKLEENNLSISNSDNLLDVICDGELKGNVGIGTDNPLTKLDIKGNSIRIQEPIIEEPKLDTIGNVGEIRWSENAIYICTKIESGNYIWKKSILQDIN